ncbi:MAG: 2-oxo acid dehydrogenase subunit E2 [Deltaproteobacteria bacterium]|nr:2-oxo acid dehydrogenase subunit E2 [Deltaproteobacteria bacterium]
MPSTFTPEDSPSAFRRIAAAMWNRPSDPSIYGYVDVDVSTSQRQLGELAERHGVRLTMTHLVSYAVARAFAAHPKLNAKIRGWGRIERRSSVDLVISVSTDGGGDLSAARVEGAENLSLNQLASAVAREVDRTRRGDDEHMTKSRNLMRTLPPWLVRPALKLSDFVGNELDWHLPQLGMPRDPFGTAVITNVGMFGIDTAFAPFVPISRCPLLLLVTEVRDRPWAVDGKIECRPVLRLCATFDHRIVDGYQAGQLAQVIRRVVENPEAAA